MEDFDRVPMRAALADLEALEDMIILDYFVLVDCLVGDEFGIFSVNYSSFDRILVFELSFQICKSTPYCPSIHTKH